ncbi:MAG: hypothetical protein Q8K98_06065 [Bacteroidota bacterium]|nr:hypothetical protein [Bacteroidota bacterium]
MVQVYLDEDVSVLLGELLKSRNIDAITARDIGMLGKTAEEHLRQAISLKRIFRIIESLRHRSTLSRREV